MRKEGVEEADVERDLIERLVVVEESMRDDAGDEANGVLPLPPISVLRKRLDVPVEESK